MYQKSTLWVSLPCTEDTSSCLWIHLEFAKHNLVPSARAFWERVLWPRWRQCLLANTQLAQAIARHPLLTAAVSNSSSGQHHGREEEAHWQTAHQLQNKYPQVKTVRTAKKQRQPAAIMSVMWSRSQSTSCPWYPQQDVNHFEKNSSYRTQVNPLCGTGKNWLGSVLWKNFWQCLKKLKTAFPPGHNPTDRYILIRVREVFWKKYKYACKHRSIRNDSQEVGLTNAHQ